MKKAILYIRVSTDEQAERGHSLAYQEEKLTMYCQLKGIEIVKLFKEDYSAKTFERPKIKEMITFLKANKNLVDEMLFIKWDRFSRNAGDAYQMIKLLNKMGVVPHATEQPLDLTQITQ
jgi:site-specific DNA recombinase